MTSQDDLTDLIEGYIGGTLSPAELERVKAKMTFSKEFRSLIEDVQKNHRLLKSTRHAAVPPGLEERILTAMKESVVPHPGSGRLFFFVRAAAMAAVAGLAAMVVFHWPAKEKPAAPPSSSSPAAPSTHTAKQEPPSFLGFREPADPLQTQPVTQPGMGAGPLISGEASRSIPLNITQPAFQASRPTQVQDETMDTFQLRGYQSGITKPTEVLIADLPSWKSLWERHSSFQHPPSNRPPISFENSDVIAIFAGSQPTGGKSVIINNIEYTTWENSPARIVSYHLSEPPPDTARTMVVTQPFLLMEIPKFQGKTIIRKSP